MGTPTAFIRARAIYLLRRPGSFLMIDWHDDYTGEPVWLAPGGSIEHGESALAAAHRELKEEVGLSGIELSHVSTFENIFEYEGMIGHEVCFAFEGVAPAQVAAMDVVPGVESNGQAMPLVWVSPAAVVAAERPLWPRPLIPFLTGQ